MGIPITQYCDKAKLTVQERLDLFIQVCHAVQHAHQKGIIHRDLKPSNILVSIYDGKPLPKIIDFGLAKALDHRTKLTDKTLFTEFGAVVGTLQYMSPEQAELDSLDIDTRADIYSLGVLLYELLTGSTPIESNSIKDQALLKVLETIRQKDPPLPSDRLSESGSQMVDIGQRRQIDPESLQKVLRRDLDWVVMKALDKDRGRRYETASAFADDINRYLSDEPVSARQPSTAYLLRKFLKKNRVAVGIAFGMLTLLVVGLIGTLAGLREAGLQTQIARQASTQSAAATQDAERSRDKAKQERDRAELAEEETLNRLYISNMNSVQLAFENSQVDRAHQLLFQYRPKEGEKDRRKFEWRYWRQALKQELRSSQATGGTALSMDVSPDGKQLASGHYDGIDMWDIDSLTLTRKLVGHTKRVTQVEFNPAGSKLFSASDDGTVRTWDAQTGQSLAIVFDASKHHSSGGAVAVQFQLSQYDLAVACSDSESGKIYMVELDTNAVHDIGSQDGSIESLSLAGDQRTLATLGNNLQMHLWDLGAAKEKSRHNFLMDDTRKFPPFRSLTYMPDGETLGICWGALFSFGSVANLQLISGTAHPNGASRLAFSKDGRLMASIGEDPTVRLWNAKDYSELAVLHGHPRPLSSICFTPDSKLLISGDGYGIIQVWDLDKILLKRSRFGVEHLGYDGDFESDDSLLLAHMNAGLTRYEVSTGRVIARYPEIKAGAQCAIEASPDGKAIVVADCDGHVRLVSADGKVLHEFQHEPGTPKVLWHPSGKQFAISTSSMVGAWSSDYRKLWQRKLDSSLSPGWETPIEYCQDGKLLAVGQKGIDFLDVETGELQKQFKDQAEWSCLRQHPTRPEIVGGTRGAEIKVVDLTTLQEQRAWKISGVASALEFADQGERLIVGYVIENHLTAFDYMLGAPTLSIALPQRASCQRLRVATDGTRMFGLFGHQVVILDGSEKQFSDKLGMLQGIREVPIQ